jgi:hypothetical protein
MFGLVVRDLGTIHKVLDLIFIGNIVNQKKKKEHPINPSWLSNIYVLL